ncbi:hypothetical protein K6119_09550 [Paracrocinitomix mangrovi]|uniref:hypothetical protein n=1 Tax=Paracrocinitomix mangrovi TaxID=2862509 RepID=UPI001C8E81B0|nr:hypothetical protein [Paracrocinitomix mangrovi]UKN03735.1 hypothetical protein K6119_09550 [Paracrocinitomix mangrovi]
MKKFVLPFILVLLVGVSSCDATKKSKEQNDGPPVSYKKDIYPIMERSCTPCHFPEKGRKEMLNNYETTVANIDEIIKRIQLKPNDIKFMPYKQKKQALSAEEIALLKNWQAQGMPE